MKSILITLIIMSSLLLQGFSGMACDHSEKAEVEESHCHSQKQDVHQSHQKHSSKDQLENSKTDSCWMCQTGVCSLEKSSFLIGGQDTIKSATKTFSTPLYFLKTGWKTSVDLKSHSLRGPPLVILLPQFKNWQAFFSIFRN